ncbi:uncharacterized protein LOC144490671 [Mustelus asterias]
MFAGSGLWSSGPRGQGLLEALYYYQYVAGDGRLVRISEGERFVLLRKSNQDWWQVRREGENRKAKAIYVPAAYVVELPGVTAAGKRASLPSKLIRTDLQLSDSWPRAGPDILKKYKRNTLGWELAHRRGRSEGQLGGPRPLSAPHHDAPRPRRTHLLPPNPDERQGSSVATMVHSWPPRQQLEPRGQPDGDTGI